MEHQPARIPCRAHGMPPVTVTWFRVEGEQQTPIPTTSKTILHKDGSLELARVAKTDEGLLACRASNGVNSALTKIIRVSVNTAAVVKIRPASQGLTLPTGSEAVLTCETRGDPPITIRWMKSGGKPLEEGRIHQTANANGLDLNISRTDPEDSGHYVCQAANIFGSDSASIQLVIQQLPRAPAELQLPSVGSRTAELNWATEEDKVQQYRIEVSRPRTDPSGNWSVLFNYTSDHHGLTTLAHLQPFSVYRVVVRAMNSAGTGPPSSPVEFQTLEEAPSGSPRHVTVESKSPRSLLVSWMVSHPPNFNPSTVAYFKIFIFLCLAAP